MNQHDTMYRDWAKIIHHEILSDGSKWHQPKGNVTDGQGIGDFDYGKMKFVNRNLNYFYFANMILHAVRNEFQFHPNFKKTLEFCEYLRPVVHEPGPYGRMCIWKLEPGCYLRPHVDNWPYHQNITRYIFCVSDNDYVNIEVSIKNQPIHCEQGLLFNFFPNTEIHHFANNSKTDFYFLGFDYWNIDKLKIASERFNITVDTELEYINEFGGFNKKTKYMSPE